MMIPSIVFRDVKLLCLYLVRLGCLPLIRGDHLDDIPFRYKQR